MMCPRFVLSVTVAVPLESARFLFDIAAQCGWAPTASRTGERRCFVPHTHADSTLVRHRGSVLGAVGNREKVSGWAAASVARIQWLGPGSEGHVNLARGFPELQSHTL